MRLRRAARYRISPKERCGPELLCSCSGLAKPRGTSGRRLHRHSHSRSQPHPAHLRLHGLGRVGKSHLRVSDAVWHPARRAASPRPRGLPLTRSDRLWPSLVSLVYATVGRTPSELEFPSAESLLFLSGGCRHTKSSRRCPDRSGKLLTAIRAHFMPPPAGWLAAIRRGSLSGPRDLGSP